MTTGKKTNFTAVILIVVIALATSFIMISCGNDTSKAEAEDTAKVKSTAVETSESGETKSDGKKSTTAAAKSTTKATEAAKVCYISIDGYCSGKSITLQGGDTAYSILRRACDNVEGSGSYVSAINGLREGDKGSQSGWMYSVNGYTPNVSCGSYGVGEGDSISWYYVTSY